MVTAANNLPRTVGELRAAGHRERGVKQEIRENLLTALAEGDEIWPGILGFDDTVLPQLERALIAGHDFVLLGERGQGKTRLLRACWTGGRPSPTTGPSTSYPPRERG